MSLKQKRAGVSNILLTVDVAGEVGSLHTLPGHRVGSLRRTEEQEVSLQTPSSAECLTLGVSATLGPLQDQTSNLETNEDIDITGVQKKMPLQANALETLTNRQIIKMLLATIAVG